MTNAQWRPTFHVSLLGGQNIIIIIIIIYHKGRLAPARVLGVDGRTKLCPPTIGGTTVRCR